MNSFLLSTFLSVSSSLVIVENHPVTIESDKAVHDYKTSVSEWEGNVILIDGPYTLNAEKLRVTYSKESDITLIEAVGLPVTIEGLHNGEKMVIEGNVVVYDQSEQNVVSTGNAVIINDRQTLRSPHIIYNIAERHLSARAVNKERERVSATFH